MEKKEEGWGRYIIKLLVLIIIIVAVVYLGSLAGFWLFTLEMSGFTQGEWRWLAFPHKLPELALGFIMFLFNLIIAAVLIFIFYIISKELIGPLTKYLWQRIRGQSKPASKKL